jgi:hypothetical protein
MSLNPQAKWRAHATEAERLRMKRFDASIRFLKAALSGVCSLRQEHANRISRRGAYRARVGAKGWKL